jgi:hypothetical protein
MPAAKGSARTPLGPKYFPYMGNFSDVAIQNLNVFFS